MVQAVTFYKVDQSRANRRKRLSKRGQDAVFSCPVAVHITMQKQITITAHGSDE